LRIARDGVWHYQGSPIRRPTMVNLFASVLNRDDAGDYWLETPAEKCRIRVDDAPFVAVAMAVSGAGRGQCLTFTTNTGENVAAGRDHPIRVAVAPESDEPSPYIHVRGGLEALVARAVFYDLVELGVGEDREGETVFGVWSGGVFFRLGDIGAE
jgi:hypothetical protein